MRLVAKQAEIVILVLELLESINRNLKISAIKIDGDGRMQFR